MMMVKTFRTSDASSCGQWREMTEKDMLLINMLKLKKYNGTYDCNGMIAQDYITNVKGIGVTLGIKA